MLFAGDDERHSRQAHVNPVTATTPVLRIALWAILLAGAAHTTTDPDLWGHVRFGLDMLRDGSIPRVDVYSFTSDRAWVNHEWLAEIVMAGAYRLGGDVGLIVLKLAAIGGMLLIVNSAFRRAAVDAPIVRDAAAAIALVLTLDQMQHVRPQLFSVVAFAALLWCVAAARDGSRRFLLLIPPLFSAWANLHGGWMVGGAVLALWTIGTAVAGRPKDAACLAVAGAAALAGTLVTPYGIELWKFLHDTVGFSRGDITEWQPIYAFGWQGWVRWTVTVTCAGAALIVGGRNARTPERIACLFGLAVAAFLVMRLQAFLAVGTVMLAGPALGHAYQRARENKSLRVTNRAARGTTAVAWCVTAAALAAAAVNITHLQVNRRLMPAPGAVAFLNTQPAGRVLVWFDWGEYAIWHLAPGMRVSIDGRRETTYSAKLQDEHLRFYFDADGGASLPATLSADYVWIPPHLPAASRLDAEGWRRVYEDGDAVVFARRQSPSRERAVMLVAATPPGSATFPGP